LLAGVCVTVEHAISSRGFVVLSTVAPNGYRRGKQNEETSMGSIRLHAAVAAAALTFAACTADVHAQEASYKEPFYKGKRLTVLVNFAAGGPADIESRIFAKHLVKHIDGQPTLVVQNMDGAGGLIGAQWLGEVAPKDGTVLGALTGTAWIYASDPERWRVDFRSYEFVARQPSTTIHFVRTDVPPGIKEPADIVKARGLIAGGLSADTSKDLRLRLGLDMLGVPFQYVTGYRSSPPARLALQRGEINMFSESPPSYRAVVEPQLVKTGVAIPVWWDEVNTSDPPPPQKQMEGLTIPSLPQLYKQIRGGVPSGKLWEAYKTLFEVNSTLQRLIVLPPGTPRAAYDAVSKAIERLNHDKDFAAEAVKAIEFAPDYPTAPDMSQTVRAMIQATPQMRTYINDYMRNVPKN
jgi:tripartite-type tricarboxylate transporter receptor subunit TctC